jgi:hypothetical protein
VPGLLSRRSDAGDNAGIAFPGERVMRKELMLLPLALALGACTWVHMAPGASAVQVVAAAPSGCEKRGEVEVSVKHSIAFIERNQLRVREELETLARNEAPGLGADTIHPLNGPTDGSQRFTAWRCGR